MVDALAQPDPAEAPRAPLLPGRKLLFAATLTLVAAAALYCASVPYRARVPYRILKDTSAGWSGSMHRVDPTLGYTTIPNASAQFLFRDGQHVLTHHDARGFRVPAEDQAVSDARPLVLALGGSYTYGYGCMAEDTYPNRVAAGLRGSALNAGVSGYGLTHMLLRARELIPEYRPDHVLVQYSPWLVLRARHPFAPTSIGWWPVPFFALDDAGSLELHPPVFPVKVLDLPVFEYRHPRAGVGDYLSFLWRVGFPLFVYEDAQLLRTTLRGTFRQADMRRTLRRDIEWPYRAPPDDSDVRVVQTVYEEIEALCRANGARMWIVMISKYQSPERHLQVLRALPYATLVDAPRAMYDRLPEPTVPEYNRAYCHWRGDPPVFADPHPNPAAHAIIAGEVVRAIRENAL